MLNPQANSLIKTLNKISASITKKNVNSLFTSVQAEKLYSGKCAVGAYLYATKWPLGN